MLLSYDRRLIDDEDSLLLELHVFQHNSNKKLDFSTGRVPVQRDKPANTKLLILIK